MNVKIKAIREKGVSAKERLVLQVLADCDIGEYAVFNAKAIGEANVSSNVRDSYWFADGIAKAGDLVVLYTKGGIKKQKVNENGSTTHFFYWGRKDPVWNESASAVVLLKIEDWDSQIA